MPSQTSNAIRTGVDKFFKLGRSATRTPKTDDSEFVEVKKPGIFARYSQFVGRVADTIAKKLNDPATKLTLTAEQTEDVEYHINRASEHFHALASVVEDAKLDVYRGPGDLVRACDRVGGSIAGLCEATDLQIEGIDELRGGLSAAVESQNKPVELESRELVEVGEEIMYATKHVLVAFAEALGLDTTSNGCPGCESWVNVSKMPWANSIETP
jgi:hypothetical protein